MPTLEFNDLLRKAEVDPRSAIVMRHRPTEKALRKALPWLAAERPDVFNAYQCSHGEKVENALSKAEWLASFIGHVPGKALFVGLYRVKGFRRIPPNQFRRMPHTRDLIDLGSRGPEGRSPLWFDLGASPALGSYKGRLVIGWPGIERSWWRRSERNVFPVEAIAEESQLVRQIQDWWTLVLPWAQLGLLPASWRSAMKQWRGIYFIFDKGSGMGYVGSAYGSDNILGRWLGYASSGHGGNQLLRRCRAEDLEFSVLQLVAQDSEAATVIALENSWKERLHTRSPLGLNGN